jgi:hypothetical protein
MISSAGLEFGENLTEGMAQRLFVVGILQPNHDSLILTPRTN